MNEPVVVQSATQAWNAWWTILKNQHEAGFNIPSRNGAVVGEVLNAVTIIQNPRKGMCESTIRKLSKTYAVGELLWYLSGSNLLKDIIPYAKKWIDMSDDGVTVNSAYGHRIFTRFGYDQWEHCKRLLATDPFTRQAVIHIKDASNQPTKDTPCTVCLQFQIRPVSNANEMRDENKLFLTVYMRSNDLWFGFPYDVFAFTSFQTLMSMELGVDVGSYTHIAGSLHLYESSLKEAGVDDTKKDKSEVLQ